MAFKLSALIPIATTGHLHIYPPYLHHEPPTKLPGMRPDLPYPANLLGWLKATIIQSESTWSIPYWSLLIEIFPLIKMKFKTEETCTVSRTIPSTRFFMRPGENWSCPVKEQDVDGTRCRLIDQSHCQNDSHLGWAVSAIQSITLKIKNNFCDSQVVTVAS